MTKTNSIIVCIVFVIACCLISQGCDASIQNGDAQSYMEVYGDKSSLSLNASVFATKGYTPNEPYVSFEDTAKAQSRQAVVFGSNVEVFYTKTETLNGFQCDWYTSKDGRYRVLYQCNSDIIRQMCDYEKNDSDEATFSEDEAKKLATEYVESRWPVFQDKQYVAKIVADTGGRTVYIRRVVNGIETSEAILLKLSSKGEVVIWTDLLRYPDGIPKEMQKALSAIDLGLCKKSVEHYIDECAKDVATKRIERGEFLYNWLAFGYDGTLTWGTYVYITTDGFTQPERFYVKIPYETGKVETNSEDCVSSNNLA